MDILNPWTISLKGWMLAETGVGLPFFVNDIGRRRYVGHNGDQMGWALYTFAVCGR